MKEVEILVQVFELKNKVLKKLKQFDFLGTKKVLDVYYYDPLRIELKPDQINKLRACFRLRQKDKQCFMAYKKDIFDKKDKWLHSEEHEIEISDLRTAENIIEHLGLKTLVEIDNLKHTYQHKNFEIVLEEVKNLGLFLEVEIKKMKSNDKVKDIKQKIWQFIKFLKIEISEELNVGKPELMLNKKILRNNV